MQMDLSTVANVATALTVITGVGFGLVEAQRSRRARQERAAYAAVQAILSPEWMRSMIAVHNIPDGSKASAIEADAGRSDEHTSDLQSHRELVCRLLLE